MGKGILSICILVVTIFNLGFSQSKKKTRQIRSPQQELSYTDKNYLNEIKTVEFYNSEKEQSIPLIHLGSNEHLHISFDDLRGDIRTFYFTFEHCNVSWEKSNLSLLEYSAGYGEERINTISRSRNTLQAYTHYQAQFPTENLRPIISGNYLLKVYEDADQSRLILTRRFYVAEEKVVINAKVKPSMDVKSRASHQKVELRVNTKGLTINNPNRDIRAVVMQNNRPDVQLWDDKPSIILGNELVYDHPNQFNFQAGQEFLYADIRSFRLQSAEIKGLETDTLVRLELMANNYLENKNYNETLDENGLFYIRNLDEEGTDELISDYGELTFTLNSSLPPTSDIYLLGAFNNYSQTDDNKLRYDKGSNSWKIKKLLKQGVYDYLYTSDSAPSFKATKNSYQVIIYYRNPRLNRDEIVGFYELNSFL